VHGYQFTLAEKNGIVYTRKAGHIDIIHVRIAADWTAYLKKRTSKCIKRYDPGFSFTFKPDISKYYVQIFYPDNWEVLPDKDKEEITSEISIRLGQYLAFTVTTWHEILTWFGYKCLGFFPEFPSAFSWEDSFSNLLGTRVAAEALQDPEHNYNKAITLAIERELEKLGVQSSHTAIRASEIMRGKWFSGHVLYLVDIKKRNLDIGLDDGFVTPTVLPCPPECAKVEVQSYPVPTLEILSEYGFSVKIEIEPWEWEKDNILRIIYPVAGKRKKRVEPAIHFARIMDYIKEDATKNYGYSVDPQQDTFSSHKPAAD
jgi:hypothetical protein